jgi:hypothetical protein
MNQDDEKELLTALANTTMAMLALLKQNHTELGHVSSDPETCTYCQQYIKQSRLNRELVTRIQAKP